MYIYCTTAKVLGPLVTRSIQGARLSLQSSELAPPVLSPASGAPSLPPSLPLSFRSGGGGTYSHAGEGTGEPIQTNGQTLKYSSIVVIFPFGPLSIILYQLSATTMARNERISFFSKYYRRAHKIQPQLRYTSS